MTEPFADEARLRAGWATYQLAYGRAMPELPLMDAVDVRTLVLYGPDDHAIGEDFVPRCKRRLGPCRRRCDGPAATHPKAKRLLFRSRTLRFRGRPGLAMGLSAPPVRGRCRPR